MKKFLFAITAALLCALWSCEKPGGDTLKIYTWDIYLDPNVVSEFEADYLTNTGISIKVEVEIFEENELMFEKVKNGNKRYDLVCPTDYIAATMIELGMVQPIDHSKIVPLAEYTPWLLGFGFDPDNSFTVPYTYGTTGIAFNGTDPKVERADMNTWGVLWNPKYSQRIMMKDNNYELFYAALAYVESSHLLQLCDSGRHYTRVYRDTLRTLFSDDISDTLKNKLHAALIQQKGIVMGYYGDQSKDLMADGQASIAHLWSNEAVYAMDHNTNVEFMLPYEGSTFYVDNWVVPTNARNVKAAHAFLKFILQPENAMRNMRHSGSPSAIASVMNDYKRQLVNDTLRFAGKSDEWKQQYADALFLSQDIMNRCTYVQSNASLDKVMNEFWEIVSDSSELKIGKTNTIE
jgi:spermidine/putrescine-binding protein